MGKQTFIIRAWSDADTYDEALMKDTYDFFRVDCKTVKTALKYLKSWKEQSVNQKELYKCFWKENAKYEIVSTPDGYNVKDVVAWGDMKDL